MDKPVKIYTLSTCSHCRAVKKFLDELDVEYDCTDVDLLQGDERKAMIEEVKGHNPRCSFPTVLIGDKVIIGFRDSEIKEELGI